MLAGGRRTSASNDDAGRRAHLLLFGHDGKGVLVTFERPASAAAPKRHAVFPVIALKHRGDVEERAVKHSAIVGGEIDQTGFLDKSAEFDQMPCARPPLHDPFPRVMSHALRLQPMSGRCRPPERFLDRRQICAQMGGLSLRKNAAPRLRQLSVWTASSAPTIVSSPPASTSISSASAPVATISSPS
jgi:hypothetical protein